MRIAVFEVEEWEREAFHALTASHDVQYIRDPLVATNAERYADTELLSTFVYSELGSEVLGKMPGLRMIATRSTGYNNIDMAYCNEHGITVSNVPAYGDCTVAEHVFALLLAISHKVVDAADRTRRGDFSLQGLQGFDLRGKTLGVLGTGNIGLCVITIAKGFGMDVIAFDVKPNESASQRLEFRYVGMDELLAASDVITLHIPSNPKTHHLLSDKQFEAMKQGVVLINTARGDIVDNRALVKALAQGQVRAAGLDVLAEEPAIREDAELLRSMYRERHDLEAILADSILLRMRNVVITPHSAFNTREAVERLLATTVENIERYLAGDPQNVVNERMPA
ncbi:MAG: hydroxyacid dehydrogenase [Anaerolineae bacterium]